jgi:hypothetical protein
MIYAATEKKRGCIKSPYTENIAQKAPGKSATYGFKPGAFIAISNSPLYNLLFRKTFDTAPLKFTTQMSLQVYL